MSDIVSFSDDMLILRKFKKGSCVKEEHLISLKNVSKMYHTKNLVILFY